MARGFRALTLLLAVAVAAGCTVKETNTPELSGPSELGLSLVMTANPDLLTQNGSSQAQIVVQALDPNGQPVRGVTIRFDVTQYGQVVDYGILSSKTAVTAADGRASVIYTAPVASLVSTDNGANIVTVLATPVSTNFANAVSRAVDIRLVPPGIIVPPSDLLAGFDYSPKTPQVMTTVVFNAPTCTVGTTNCSAGSIAGYTWDFGDGSKGAGQVVSHQFGNVGTYPVTLTVFDPLGRAASTTQIVTVAAGTAPTASFVTSPSAPTLNETVFFNATSSKPAAGRFIVDFEWDFGDGVFGHGVTISHAYGKAGSFTVTLVVTDDAGQKSSTSKSVTVTAPVSETSSGSGR
jgi:PKD repeat protein